MRGNGSILSDESPTKKSRPQLHNSAVKRTMSTQAFCLFSVFGCGILISLYRTTHSISSTALMTKPTSPARRSTMTLDEYPSWRTERRPRNDIAVFYNLYVNASTDEELIHVSNIIDEQFGSLQPWHRPVFVHSIGQEYPIPNTTLLQHHEQATEMVTLRSLWEYCREERNINASVVYLHSKGSFHPSALNDQLRKFNTLGALSDDCSNMPHTCNVCSSRFSPFPHPHPPGNMWQAKCSYVKHLNDPDQFERDMEIVKHTTIGNIPVHPSCLGAERFAAEHWIHSHPFVEPCDLYINKRYGWGYEMLEEFVGLQDFQLVVGPRYPRSDWRIGCPHSDLNHRLNEYKILYNMVPKDDWWGWEFWMEEV
ncbi:hypothetical protein IV203_013692 [Nitzschia inconspicua]|uniref:Uncharacterized protein n=1 Tax=Nitzschia inconspicua TaxID=303405 RepID=A0A9K3M608_9STRA|nr:hypothetical protein IV203_013692 [Nitzschia inconspicua]